jgi:hypothetical protein
MSPTPPWKQPSGAMDSARSAMEAVGAATGKNSNAGTMESSTKVCCVATFMNGSTSP